MLAASRHEFYCAMCKERIEKLGERADASKRAARVAAAEEAERARNEKLCGHSCTARGSLRDACCHCVFMTPRRGARVTTNSSGGAWWTAAGACKDCILRVAATTTPAPSSAPGAIVSSSLRRATDYAEAVTRLTPSAPASECTQACPNCADTSTLFVSRTFNNSVVCTACDSIFPDIFTVLALKSMPVMTAADSRRFYEKVAPALLRARAPAGGSPPASFIATKSPISLASATMKSAAAPVPSAGGSGCGAPATPHCEGDSATLATMMTLLEELSCVVCFETYKNPTTLPCGHTFCRECCVSLAAAGTTPAAPAATSTRPRVVPDSLTCPMCRRVATDVSKIGVNRQLTLVLATLAPLA